MASQAELISKGYHSLVHLSSFQYVLSSAHPNTVIPPWNKHRLPDFEEIACTIAILSEWSPHLL